MIGQLHYGRIHFGYSSRVSGLFQGIVCIFPSGILQFRYSVMKKRNICNTVIIIAIVLAGSTVVATPALAQGTKQCAGADTSVIECDENLGGKEAIIKVTKDVIRIMTGGIVALAVGAVIVGGIIYATSEGSPDKLKKAREIWINTVIGLLLFAFMVTITNFLIPGGVFG